MVFVCVGFGGICHRTGKIDHGTADDETSPSDEPGSSDIRSYG